MTPQESSPAITSEAQTKLLLSSISLAITNTGWLVIINHLLLTSYLPVFFPYLYKFKNNGVTCTLVNVRGVAYVPHLKWFTCNVFLLNSIIYLVY